MIYSICLTRVSRLSIVKKMSDFSFRNSPKLTRVEITTSTRMKTRYTHSRIKRLINSVYDYLEIQQWNSIFSLPLSLSQFVISSSQSKGDGRFFSLEIFLPIAINVANRNRATFHILISAKLMFRFHVLYQSIFCSDRSWKKLYINNRKSTIEFTNYFANSSLSNLLSDLIFYLLF